MGGSAPEPVADLYGRRVDEAVITMHRPTGLRTLGRWVDAEVKGAMSEFVPVLLLFGVVVGLVAAGYATSALLAVRPPAVDVPAFAGGLAPVEHAVSRFHVRWYPVTLVFLAFDMEMLFMYPWTLVVSRVGPAAVVEMFLFLGILLAGVLYAWREGALRWT